MNIETPSICEMTDFELHLSIFRYNLAALLLENGVNWKNVVGLEIGGDHKNKSRNILVLEEPFLGGVPRAFLVMVRNQVKLLKKGSSCN